MEVQQTKCSWNYLVIFGGFCIHLATGAMYTHGNFLPYIISYIRNRTDDETIKNVDLLWLDCVCSVGYCTGLTIGGLNAHEFGDRMAIFIGSLIFCGSTAVSYFTVQQSYIVLMATYGLLSSLGIYLTYGTPIQTGIKWWPQHATLVTGLIVSGSGGGSILFNQVITWYINPDNISPDLTETDGERYFSQSDVLDKVPTCFVILGSVYFFLQMIGLACISEPPMLQIESAPVNSSEVSVNHAEGAVTKSDNNVCHIGFVNKAFTTTDNTKTDQELFEDNITDIHSDPRPTKDLSIVQAIKESLTSRSFYVIWFIFLFINIGMQFVMSLYKAYGQTFIGDDHFLALVGSTAAVFNCVGRPVWGAVMDKAGFGVAIRLISGGLTVLFGTLLLTEKMPKEMFLVWICSMYLFCAGTFSLVPSALAKMLGPKNMAINYGLVNTALIAAYSIGGTVGTTLIVTIGWNGLFYIAAGLSSLVFVISFLFNGVDQTGKRI